MGVDGGCLESSGGGGYSQGESIPQRAAWPRDNKNCAFYKEKMQPSSRSPKLEPLPSALPDRQTGGWRRGACAGPVSGVCVRFLPTPAGGARLKAEPETQRPTRQGQLPMGAGALPGTGWL